MFQINFLLCKCDPKFSNTQTTDTKVFSPEAISSENIKTTNGNLFYINLKSKIFHLSPVLQQPTVFIQ